MKLFDRNVRESEHSPKDGSAPLTIVQFSLIDKVRDDLRDALLPYLNAEVKDDVALAKIISDHMPKEVMDELAVLSKEGGSPSTVFIVKNLPELSKKEFKEQGAIHRPKHTIKHLTYADLISRGLGVALNLKRQKTYPLWRAKKNLFFEGHMVHKHAEAVTTLSGIIGNGARTRFSDLQTMIEDPGAHEAIADVNVIEGFNVLNVRLSELPTKISSYLPASELYFSMRNPAFETLVDKHSLEVTLKRGDMILWANDGRIFHQAMKDIKPNTRAALNSAFER